MEVARIVYLGFELWVFWYILNLKSKLDAFCNEYPKHLSYKDRGEFFEIHLGSLQLIDRIPKWRIPLDVWDCKEYLVRRNIDSYLKQKNKKFIFF